MTPAQIHVNEEPQLKI